MRERDTLKEEATKNGCALLLNEFRVKRNQVKTMLKSDKVNYYRDRFYNQTLSLQKVWKSVYNILGKEQNKSPKLLRHENKIVSNPKMLAELLNKTFQEKLKKLRVQTNFQPKDKPSDRLRKWLSNRQQPPPHFSLHPITLTDLRGVLKKTKFSRSHGIDFMDSYSIKLAGPLIEDALLHIVNLSITLGVFPSSWKKQLVLPLHKKNDKLDASNYRPVSHMTELGKLLERVIHEQVYEHFVKHKLSHTNHHGFVGNHSTATTLIQLQDLWLSAAEEKKMTAAILLDLFAAFDDKLRLYEFSDKSID